MKPFSQACKNNQHPILNVLIRVFSDRRKVLEIGSGTGQHAVYFSKHLPHLEWITSDLQENIDGINQWIAEFPQDNLHPPLWLDVTSENWEVPLVDAVFSANSLHIMEWSAVEKLFQGIAKILHPGGVFAVYGPFKYKGEFTSESNQHFDGWLKDQQEHRGIRDFEQVDALATQTNLTLIEDNDMPAYNRLLVWRRNDLPKLQYN